MSQRSSFLYACSRSRCLPLGQPHPTPDRLNEDSPPLTPTDDPDEQSEYQQYVNAFRQQFVPKEAVRHHGAPKHHGVPHKLLPMLLKQDLRSGPLHPL